MHTPASQPCNLSIKQQTKHKLSEVAQFASAAFYAAIQKPINGALQSAEKITTLSLPRMIIVDAHGSDGENATNAQKVGELLGSIVPYVASRAAAHYGLSGLAAPFRSAASEGALAGALMGGVLTPVDDKDNFWQKKGALAFIDASTFGTMEGVGKALKSFKLGAADGGIDWNLKNMKMHDGKLYIFDPSFMHDTPMDRELVDLFGRAIGPRPAKFQPQ